MYLQCIIYHEWHALISFVCSEYRREEHGTSGNYKMKKKISSKVGLEHSHGTVSSVKILRHDHLAISIDKKQMNSMFMKSL